MLRQSGLNEHKNKENQRTFTEQQKKSGIMGSGSRHLSFFEKDFSLVHRQPSALHFDDTLNVQRDLRREFSREGLTKKETEKTSVIEDIVTRAIYQKGAQRSNSFYNNSNCN